MKLMTHVADIGPPADWVKINVRETKDCFEVYALVPGLLREEVKEKRIRYACTKENTRWTNGGNVTGALHHYCFDGCEA
ncbi:AT-rich interactive domain-containing protein 5 [Camellia lanceoleosa]|uniref:AT-rich interactive domain-containing protein 5 n=1 Tax=Camellia lanceoleosa TaxID=1840588 RepID=A0ACC0FU35_9ERIC|nr:AT-rich interactive domain-containing protein 5 [Camellia lanceoleosa]